MEVKKIKVIKEVEVEEEAFCFTREETKLIAKFIGASTTSTVTSLGLTVEDDQKLYNILRGIRRTIPVFEASV